jgi:uncharacterized protein (DUF1499 family)
MEKKQVKEELIKIILSVPHGQNFINQTDEWVYGWNSAIIRLLDEVYQKYDPPHSALIE